MQLKDRLLLQDQHDIEGGSGLFPGAFLAELLKAGGAHAASHQVLQEGPGESVRSASRQEGMGQAVPELLPARAPGCRGC